MSEVPEEDKPPRLLMIGLDAAEFNLIERWSAEGHLPNLAALRERGTHAPLRMAPHWLIGAPWPSFYCSGTAEQFGMYHYLVWRPELMTAERPDPEWMPLEPFWRRLPEHDRKVIAIDVPLCYAPRAYDGVEVSGWATHEILQAPGSSPPGLLKQVHREFGRVPFDEESAHQLSIAEFMRVRDQCAETARMVGELGCALMSRHRWDLALICLSSTHRGGHLLWDRTILKRRPTATEAESVDNALREVYMACDRAVGRLIERAGRDAAVMVFSLHGMGSNNDRTSVLPEMLARILEDRRSDDRPVRRARLSDRLRALLPAELRARVKKRLPRTLQDRLTLYWRSSRVDWSRTRAFIAFCDLDGYIRVNLRGREREGIVAREEYTALCERIADGLRTFRDADSGESLVGEIGFGERIFSDGPMREYLPDLIVCWQASSAATHRRLVSDRYGSIDWPTPGRQPLGRSGNHRRTGFLIAAGGEFETTTLPQDASIIDLAPTALDVLRVPVPASFCGKSMLRPSSRHALSGR